MRMVSSSTIIVLVGIAVAGCETMPKAGDTDPPGILVADGHGSGFVATNIPDLALRQCPNGSEATTNYIYPDRVYPKTVSGPVTFSVLASDTSGIKKIMVQLHSTSSISGISPTGAIFSNNETYMHGTGTYVADFIRLDLSGETPISLRGLSFTYAGPVPGVIYVWATDFNDNTAFIGFVVASAASACN